MPGTGNSLDLNTLRFLNACEQAHFDTGDHIHFRIKFLAPGFYYTEISDNGGMDYAAITNENGLITYGTFAEALNAIVEHKREM